MKPSTIKVLTWNVGVFQPLTYLKLFGIRLKNHNVEHEFFHKHNGDFISEYIKEQDPDVAILLEILSFDDVTSIPALSMYPYQELLPIWGDNNILIASKKSFRTEKIGSIFYRVTCGNLTIIPLHLNSFSSRKRKTEVSELVSLIQNIPTRHLLAVGDTNLWERNKRFLFSLDKQTYYELINTLPEASSHVTTTHYFGASIDKVFHKNTLRSTIRCDRRLGVFMDHYPVMTELSESNEQV